jgi:predicted glycosyltransferase
MRILLDVNHPAHVHLFKNLAWDLKKMDHEVLWVARTRDVVQNLLDYYGFSYKMLTKAQKGIIGLGVELLERDVKLFKVAKDFQPDIMMGTSVCITHVGKLRNIPSFYWGEDNQDIKKLSKIAYPFADVICTPDCFEQSFGEKHVKYPSYHELAYLHPGRFIPNPDVLEKLKITKTDSYFILRFVSFKASHDIRESGISLGMGYELIEFLSKYGKVFVNSEIELPEYIEKYRVNIAPYELHDVLSYATMCIGDSQTVVAEAAVLGTPSIRCNTYVGHPDKVPYLDELEERYGLVYNYRPEDRKKMFDKITKLLKMSDLKRKWGRKRAIMIRDKVDLTKWMIDFVTNYPESLEQYKRGY